MTHSELKEFLDEKVELYNNPNFIESDPIQIPHLYSLKEDHRRQYGPGCFCFILFRLSDLFYI